MLLKLLFEIVPLTLITRDLFLIDSVYLSLLYDTISEPGESAVV